MNDCAIGQQAISGISQIGLASRHFRLLPPVIPAFSPVIPAFSPVIPAFSPVIPAKAGIQRVVAKPAIRNQV